MSSRLENVGSVTWIYNFGDTTYLSDVTSTVDLGPGAGAGDGGGIDEVELQSDRMKCDERGGDAGNKIWSKVQ
jgi:hypothetical protein